MRSRHKRDTPLWRRSPSCYSTCTVLTPNGFLSGPSIQSPMSVRLSSSSSGLHRHVKGNGTGQQHRRHTSDKTRIGTAEVGKSTTTERQRNPGTIYRSTAIVCCDYGASKVHTRKNMFPRNQCQLVTHWTGGGVGGGKGERGNGENHGDRYCIVGESLSLVSRFAMHGGVRFIEMLATKYHLTAATRRQSPATVLYTSAKAR